jgi:catalase
MKIKSAITMTILAAVGMSIMPVQSKEKVQANDLVEMFEKMNGVHPGNRRVHAKGVCAKATFTPNPNKYFPSAAILSNGELPVTMRFSLGSGNPSADERIPGTRGMGMKINLPDGSVHIIAGNNFPVFSGKDPKTFHGFLSVLLPGENGKPDMKKVMAYIKANPSVAQSAAWQQQAQTPSSFANTEFFGLHTFYFDSAQGKRTKFRWQLVPELGVETFDKEAAAKLPKEFLQAKLKEQIKSSTVSYNLEVSIGKPEDSDIDPSIQWPQDRATVTLGKITLQEAGGSHCAPLNFDPNALSAGFTPSDDPILRMRSPAYAISFGKRLAGQ